MRSKLKKTRRKRGTVLTCLAVSGLAVLFLVPAIYARYRSRDEGRTGARVAAFQVSVSQAELVSPDSEASGTEDEVVYQLRVKNESECDAIYRLELVNDSGHLVDHEITEPEGSLGIGEEKTVRISLSVPEETFRSITENMLIEGLAVDVSLTQAEPGGAP